MRGGARFEEPVLLRRRGARADTRNGGHRKRQPGSGALTATGYRCVLAGQGVRSCEPRRETQLRCAPPDGRTRRWYAADLRRRWWWRRLGPESELGGSVRSRAYAARGTSGGLKETNERNPGYEAGPLREAHRHRPDHR